MESLLYLGKWEYTVGGEGEIVVGLFLSPQLRWPQKEARALSLEKRTHVAACRLNKHNEKRKNLTRVSCCFQERKAS